mmetsp:Transcript_55422/g.119216  ORF Transcript_55422/g.119216 Transcript_55422/m.119216 type:complete len:426 (-) Transcript_55422:47-1324(-)
MDRPVFTSVLTKATASNVALPIARQVPPACVGWARATRFMRASLKPGKCTQSLCKKASARTSALESGAGVPRDGVCGVASGRGLVSNDNGRGGASASRSDPSPASSFAGPGLLPLRGGVAFSGDGGESVCPEEAELLPGEGSQPSEDDAAAQSWTMRREAMAAATGEQPPSWFRRTCSMSKSTAAGPDRCLTNSSPKQMESACSNKVSTMRRMLSWLAPSCPGAPRLANNRRVKRSAGKTTSAGRLARRRWRKRSTRGSECKQPKKPSRRASAPRALSSSASSAGYLANNEAATRAKRLARVGSKSSGPGQVAFAQKRSQNLSRGLSPYSPSPRPGAMTKASQSRSLSLPHVNNSAAMYETLAQRLRHASVEPSGTSRTRSSAISKEASGMQSRSSNCSFEDLNSSKKLSSSSNASTLHPGNCSK